MRIALYTRKNNKRIELLANEFTKLGCKIVLIFVDENVSLRAQLEEAYGEPCDFAMGFSGDGINISTKSGENIHDVLQIPYLGFIQDPPYNPNSILLRTTKINQLICLCYDRSQLRLLSSCIPEIKLGGYVQEAPWNIVSGSRSITEREIPIAFLATNHKFDRNWRSEGKGITAILDDVADYMLGNENMSLSSAIEYINNNSNVYLCKEVINRVFSPFNLHLLDGYIRSVKRNQLLKTIAKSGLCVDVYGDGWEHFANRGGLKIHNCRSDSSIWLKSKIILNENALIVEGIHDRVLHGMVNGACVVSDNKFYYDKIFECGKEIETYTWAEIDKLPQQLFDLLNDDEKMQKMADAGQRKVVVQYSWAHCATVILELVDLYKKTCTRQDVKLG